MVLTGGILFITFLIIIIIVHLTAYLIHRITDVPFDLCFIMVTFGIMLLMVLGIVAYMCIINWNTPVMWFN